MTQLYVWTKPEEWHQLNKVKEWVKDIFDKTKVLVLGAHVGRSKLSDYIVTLSVSSCQQVMVIIDSKHSF